MVSTVIGLVLLGAMVVVLVVAFAAVHRVNRLNRASPLSQSQATVVDKREKVSSSGLRFGALTATTYYATFELPSGLRLEMVVTGPAFGQLVVGDTGQLTRQGTWFRGFERQLLR